MLRKIKVYKGTLTVKSGLHIGCGGETGKIGGCDDPVIRDMMTNMPYIPGSSLKGKLRSSLELNGAARNKEGMCNCGRDECIVCKIFGSMGVKKNKDSKEQVAEAGQARIIIPDMYVNEEFMKNFTEKGFTPDQLTEVKAETAIERKPGKAVGGSLRNFERIVKGAVFDVQIILKIFDGDDETKMVDALKKAVKLTNATGLGAKTSAGSGQVDIQIDWNGSEV